VGLIIGFELNASMAEAKRQNQDQV
jgi:hypothetical protein